MEELFDLTNEYLKELGWVLRAEQHSRQRTVYEKKGGNLWMVVLRERDCPPFIHFVPIDPSLAGPSEHGTKGNVYVQNVMDLKILLWMVEYLPVPYSDYKNKLAYGNG